MENKRPLTSEEISAILDGFEPIDVDKMDMMAKLPSSERWLVICRKSEAIRADLRSKLMEDFPELPSPEINMKVLRSFSVHGSGVKRPLAHQPAGLPSTEAGL